LGDSLTGTATLVNSWAKILQHMERRVNPHSFTTWFRPTRQQGAENGKLLVRVPNRMFRKKLSETYGSLLEAVLTEVGMADTRVEFLCDEPEAPPPVLRKNSVRQAILT
jgi:chromosomal replication initiation ATPase DnaA